MLQSPISKGIVTKTDGAMTFVFQSRQPIQQDEHLLRFIKRLFLRGDAVKSRATKPKLITGTRPDSAVAG